MSKPHDYAIYIGRFQPFHKAHEFIATRALETAENLIFVIGSHLTPRTIENPFTAQERQSLIEANFFNKEEYKNRIHFVYMRDHLYNDNVWATDLQNKIDQVVKDRNAKIVLTGSLKDDSSFYLKMFPQWKRDFVKPIEDIHATTIRNDWFNENLGTLDIRNITKDTAFWLTNFSLANKQVVLDLKKEFQFINDYKKSWEKAPYPVTFQTVDAVVFKSAHVLVVKRKINPGKGLYALPGGFLNPKERLLDGALRELKEETQIVYPIEDLKNQVVESKVFDHPKRSLRGRTITNAFNFYLGDGRLPEVKGADDAEDAMWMSFSDVSRNLERFFEDHAHIIEYFMYKQGSR